jgi:hypothetical protein
MRFPFRGSGVRTRTPACSHSFARIAFVARFVPNHTPPITSGSERIANAFWGLSRPPTAMDDCLRQAGVIVGSRSVSSRQ